LLNEDPSAHKPWTKTIFGVAVVAFALVVVLVVVVLAFVAVAMPSEASGSIKVLLLFSVLAKPERGVKARNKRYSQEQQEHKTYPFIMSS
jgi:hypothetical protein